MSPSPLPCSSSYALGLLFLVIVSVLWTACSVVVQHLYRDMEFDSPFLVVYVGTSLFSIFLPLRLGYERWGSGRGSGGSCCGGGKGGEEEAVVAAIPWRNVAVTDAREVGVEVLRPAEHLWEEDDGGANGGATIDGRGGEGVAGWENGLGHPADFSNDGPAASAGTRNRGPSRDGHGEPYLLSHVDHISMASRVAPLWLFSNYLYAMSLRWTTIASSTVLASMGSVFAFGFATCSRYGDERVTRWKLVGVALCFLGGVATTYTDVDVDGDVGSDGGGGGGEEGLRHLRYLRYLRHSSEHHLFPRISDLDDGSPMLILLGDLAGLLSAVGYGAYT